MRESTRSRFGNPRARVAPQLTASACPFCNRQVPRICCSRTFLVFDALMLFFAPAPPPPPLQIPADVRIIECSDNMVVDNAPLTGESEPQKRKALCTHDEPMETQVND